jgi:hypothetical protein
MRFPCFAQGGDLRQRRLTPFRRHGERPQPASLDVGQGGGDGVDHRLDLAGQQILPHGPGAAVGDVDHVEAAALGDQLHHHVVGAAIAGGAVVQAPRLGEHECHELRECRGADAWMNHEHDGKAAEQGNRGEIGDRIERQPDAQRRREGVTGRRGHEQRVAVGCAARDMLAGNSAVAAGPVVDDDAAPERLAQALGDQPRGDVGAAAGRERNHQADRLFGPGMCLRGRGRAAEQHRDQGDRLCRAPHQSRRKCLLSARPWRW